MQPHRPPPEHAAPAEGGARWGTRFFARVLEQLPAATPAVERQLLQSAYEIHRLTDAMRHGPSPAQARRLTEAIADLEATAAAAVEAGVPPGYVRQLAAMTVAVASEILDAALGAP
jgi:hypothetical protein